MAIDFRSEKLASPIGKDVKFLQSKVVYEVLVDDELYWVDGNGYDNEGDHIIVMKEEFTAARGDRFEICGMDYLLAMYDTKGFVLINTRDGNRWHDPVEVKQTIGNNGLTISEEDFRKVLGPQSFEIEKIWATKHRG